MKSEAQDRIVELNPLTGRSNWVRLVLECHEPIDLPISVWTELSLTVGSDLNVVDMNALEHASTMAEAKESALRYLRFRSRTMQEVTRHLTRKGVTPANAQAVVQELTASGLLSDAAYAVAFHAAKQTLWSRAQVLYKLRERGISDEFVRPIVDGHAARDAEVDTARRVAAKYWRTQSETTPSKRALKLAGYLTRRGFPTDVIRSVTSELVQEGFSDFLE